MKKILIIILINIYILLPKIIRLKVNGFYKKVINFYWIQFKESNFFYKKFFFKFFDDTEDLAKKNKKRSLDLLLSVYKYDEAYMIYMENKEFFDDISDEYRSYFFSMEVFLRDINIFKKFWQNLSQFDNEKRNKLYITIHPILILPQCFLKENKYIYGNIIKSYFEIVVYLNMKYELIFLPQYGLNNIFFSLDNIVISFHTYSSVSSKSIHIKESPLWGYLNCDKKGYSGWSEYSKKKNYITLSSDYLSRFNLIRSYYVENKISKYVQNSNMKIEKNGFIFLALQLENDTVAELANIKTYELLKLVYNYSLISGETVIVKRHPFCKSKKVSKFLKSYCSENFFVSDASIHELIPKSKVVVTVNSGVGLESLFYLKPVIVTGLCDYVNVVNYAKNKNELFKFLKNFSINKDEVKFFMVDYVDNMISLGNLEVLNNIIDEYSVD